MDWLAILQDGEESPKHFGSESDLSVWSEDSEAEELSSRSRHSDQHEPVLAGRKVAQDSFSLDNTMETWFQVFLNRILNSYSYSALEISMILLISGYCTVKI